MAKPQKPKDIDGYISQFPTDVQAILEKVRATIRHAAPEAKETISYLMPAFKLHGILVYFAAWKKHIGLYPPTCRCDSRWVVDGPNPFTLPLSVSAQAPTLWFDALDGDKAKGS